MSSSTEDQLDRLQRELSKVKRWFRTLLAAVGGLVLAGGVLASMNGGIPLVLAVGIALVGATLAWAWNGTPETDDAARTHDDQKVLRAHALILEDEDGITRGSLEITESGPWGLFLNDAAGMLRAALLAGEGGAGINLYDGAGELRSILDVSEERPTLILNDDRGKARIRVDVTDGGPRVGLFDQAGEQRAALGATRIGPILNLFGEAGEAGVVLQLTKPGPRISLKDETGEELWSAPR